MKEAHKHTPKMMTPVNQAIPNQRTGRRSHCHISGDTEPEWFLHYAPLQRVVLKICARIHEAALNDRLARPNPTKSEFPTFSTIHTPKFDNKSRQTQQNPHQKESWTQWNACGSRRGSDPRSKSFSTTTMMSSSGIWHLIHISISPYFRQR